MQDRRFVESSPITHEANQIESVSTSSDPWTGILVLWAWWLRISYSPRKQAVVILCSTLVVQGLTDGNRILAVDIMMSYLVPGLGNIRLACAKIQVIIN